MLYFIFGVKVNRGDESRIVPITESLFNPDIHVINQKIIKHVFPNASDEFIKEAINNNELSPIEIFPSKYVKNGEISTLIDPLVDYSIFSRIGKNAKHSFNNQLFIKELQEEIENIITSGFKGISRPGYQFQQGIKNRNVTFDNNESSKILISMITWKITVHNNMFITVDPEDDTLYNAIIKNLIFFNSTSNKFRFGMKIKFGFLDVQNDEFSPIASFNPILFDINLAKRNDIRMLHYSEDQFIGNLIDYGISENNMKVLKKIAANRKRIKFK